MYTSDKSNMITDLHFLNICVIMAYPVIIHLVISDDSSDQVSESVKQLILECLSTVAKIIFNASILVFQSETI